MNASDEPRAMLAADDRTLRLAAPVVTADRLEQFVAYQRRLLALLQTRRPSGAGEELLAAARLEAAAGGTLSTRELSGLEALCRDFCGRRWTERELARRLEGVHARLAEVRARGETPADRDVALATRLEKELRGREARTLLSSRYGQEAIDLLAGREEELLALHRSIEAALLPLPRSQGR